MKPFQTSCEKGEESRAEEKKSYWVIKNSKPCAEEGQSINSSGIPNLVWKKKETLLQDLMQKKSQDHQEL